MYQRNNTKEKQFLSSNNRTTLSTHSRNPVMRRRCSLWDENSKQIFKRNPQYSGRDQELNPHVRSTVTPEPLITICLWCLWCNGFIQCGSNVRRHQMVYTKEKPFLCDTNPSHLEVLVKGSIRSDKFQVVAKKHPVSNRVNRWVLSLG